MSRTGEQKAHQFPRGPVLAAFRRWLERQEWDERSNGENQFSEKWEVGPISPLHRLVQDSGVKVDFLYALKNRPEALWVDFDLADKIITAIDPHLWRCDPDLAKAYQEFDLARLDARRPIVKAAA